MILASDIGGTNARLALFDIEKIGEPIIEKSYPTKNFSSFIELISAFQTDFSSPIHAAGIAVAGPVIEGRVQITNLPWIIDEEKIGDYLGNIPVRLLNDLVGMSNYIPHLKSDDLFNLNTGLEGFNSPIAVIAPGTGLGEAYLIRDGSGYKPYPSEGGHTDFGPVNELQEELLSFMAKKYSHVSYERICSGLGIPDIYRFFKDVKKIGEPKTISKRIRRADDPVPIIFESASGSSKICQEVVNLFVDILAAEAGNLALKLMAHGGIYLGGGIPPKILGKLEERFMSSYLNKGRLDQILEQIPVNVILHSNPALYGAAHYASELLN